MSSEVRKILCSRFCVILFAALILANAAAFSSFLRQDRNGYTYAQIQEMYAQRDNLEALRNELGARVLQDVSDWDETLLTGHVLFELDLVRATQDRVREAENYSQHLDQILLDANAKLASGLFERDSFYTLVLERTVETYEKLRNRLTPEVSFSGGIELLTKYRLTDLFALIFGLTSGLLLLTLDRSSGFLCLTRPTKRGHGALYCRKFCAMALVLALGFLTLYGTNLALTASMLGFGNLSRPVQSLFGMAECPYPLTVLGYLLFFFGIKALWIFAISSLFFFLCACTDNAAAVLGAVAGLLGLSLIFASTPNLWLRLLSLSRLSDTNSLFSCFYLNFFGHPIKRVSAALAYLGALVLAGFGGGCAVFCKSPAIPTVRKARIQGLPRGRYTSLTRHEFYKVFCSAGGICILCLFLLAQILAYRDFTVRTDEFEYYYRQYSQTLSGPPTPEKDDFLLAEQARFDEIQEQLDRYAQIAGDDALAYELLTQDLRQQLRAQEPFEAARQQYESLSGEQVYIYQTGYERLYGSKGRSDDLENTAKLIFVLILGLSRCFAMEYETGVRTLQISSGKLRAITKAKVFAAAAYLLLALLLAYLPQYLAILNCCGLPHTDAVANSLPVFRQLSNHWSIRLVLAFTCAVRVLLGTAVSAVILTISNMTKNTISALLLCLCLLLFPMLAVI